MSIGENSIIYKSHVRHMGVLPVEIMATLLMRINGGVIAGL